MKVPLSWLREFVQLELDTAALSNGRHTLTVWMVDPGVIIDN